MPTVVACRLRRKLWRESRIWSNTSRTARSTCVWPNRVVLCICFVLVLLSPKFFFQPNGNVQLCALWHVLYNNDTESSLVWIFIEFNSVQHKPKGLYVMICAYFPTSSVSNYIINGFNIKKTILIQLYNLLLLQSRPDFIVDTKLWKLWYKERLDECNQGGSCCMFLMYRAQWNNFFEQKILTVCT